MTVQRKRVGAAMILAVAAVVGTATFEIGSVELGQAHAIIGRPFTPVSVAGVARRSTRRAVYGPGYGLAVGSVAVGVTAAAAAATVATLPAGCPRYTTHGSLYYGCGGRYYVPVYDGPEVVYVVEDTPPK